MIDFFKSLQREVNRKIDKVERSEKDTIKKALEASHILGEAFDRLKKFILDYTFKDENEEIDFFRERKPWICSRLIYYRKLYNIEMNRPLTSVETQREYINKELEAINIYTAKRLDFIRYYRSGQSYLDKLYFLRNQTDTEQYLEKFYYERDPQYSTNCDFKVANIQANDMLIAYLMTEIDKLDVTNYNCKVFGFPPFDERLTWQDGKTALLEYIYMFDSKGTFGDVTLTEIASYFAHAFNVRIDLSNLSRAFCDMKIRNDPTPAIDAGKKALLKRMKRDNEEEDKDKE